MEFHLNPELDLSVLSAYYAADKRVRINQLLPEEQALALARLQSKQALQQNWPDFELLARKEDVSVEENALHYRVVYTITADICK